MVRAVAQLRDQGLALRYVIAGIGEDADYLDGLIRVHNLSGVAHRIGAVSEIDLPRWMNACDVFAMPNREVDGDNEGFGMVFIEAAACGKPSLAGLAGGTGSAVLHEETGLRVDGDSLEVVASSLRRMLDDEQLRVQMASSAYERATQCFSWDAVAAKTNEVRLL
jgi:phosphatidylinositol alpha-1,6-mannosyltransferase